MPGITFLFWNVNRQPLEPRVARVVAARAVDVVILAECETHSPVVSRTLSGLNLDTFRKVPGSGEKLHLFSRIPLTGWAPLYREPLDAWLAFRLSAPPLPELLLFAAHLPSKLHTEEYDRLNDGSLLRADVERMERQEKHARTILVGDLNANPFEPSINWAGGIHGVMTREIARRETREIRGRDYPMFYNPMWGFFGDRTPGPPGTYYRSSSQAVNYFWNTFDQVLLRPELMDRLTALEILDTDGTDSLLTANGMPDATTGSDHLPLLFRLDW